MSDATVPGTALRPRPAGSSRARRRALVVAACLLGGTLIVLWWHGIVFLLRHYPFLPPCLFHQLTGWHCPGCGSTRAVLALMEGDPVRAVRNNLLLAATLPVLGWWAIQRLRGRPLPRPGWWLPALAGVVIAAYWVLRNLPAFAWLAPFDAG